MKDNAAVMQLLQAFYPSIGHLFSLDRSEPVVIQPLPAQTHHPHTYDAQGLSTSLDRILPQKQSHRAYDMRYAQALPSIHHAQTKRHAHASDRPDAFLPPPRQAAPPSRIVH